PARHTVGQRSPVDLLRKCLLQYRECDFRRIGAAHGLICGHRVFLATPYLGVPARNVVTMQAMPDLIDTAVAQAAIRLSQSTESPAVFNHSVRSYLFSELRAAHDGMCPGADYDSETLFLGSVLHDLGAGTAASGKARFEVEGADLAAALLTEYGCERTVVDAVWEAIALHTSFGIVERRGPIGYLVNAGLGLDFGRKAEWVDDQTAPGIHARYPRLSMVPSVMDAIVAQAERSPEAAPPYTFPGELLRERRADGISVLERAASLSRWGE